MRILCAVAARLDYSSSEKYTHRRFTNMKIVTSSKKNLISNMSKRYRVETYVVTISLIENFFGYITK